MKKVMEFMRSTQQAKSHRSIFPTTRFLLSWFIAIGTLFASQVSSPRTAHAAPQAEAAQFTVTHKKSQISVTGTVGVSKFIIQPSGSGRDIYVVDDGIRRTFIPRHEAVEPVPAPSSLGQNYHLEQKVVGVFSSIPYAPTVLTPNRPFDEFGRRLVRAQTHRGVKFLLQGITTLTPTYCRVQGIELTGRKEFEAPFDERISTSSIRSATLIKILRNATDDLNSVDQRERIVLFLIAAKRYVEARQELRSMMLDFPKWTKTDRFQQFNETINNEIAKTGLNELRLRLEAGQRKLVKSMLDNFDTSEVTADVLLQINTLRKESDKDAENIKQLKKQIEKDFSIVTNDSKVAKTVRETLKEIHQEILQDIGPNNYKRLSTYQFQASDPAITHRARVAYLVTGWLMGSAAAIDSLDRTIAIYHTKKRVVQYLKSTDPIERQGILSQIKSSEGGSVKNIAAIARHIKPWKESKDAIKDQYGVLHLKLDHLEGQPEFLVTLPPEYDPYKRYPCVVAVCDSYRSPLSQMNWWKGQADRNGYIVIAPDWRQKGKKTYDYSIDAAVVVLASLREAKRRFSVDPDRVYISGHLRGAEVAVDLGLAHPDLWAGILNISPIYEKYIGTYKSNLRFRVPIYSVFGERHTPSARGMIGSIDRRASMFNHWAQSGDFNSVVVQYRGRQGEFFFEEIHRIFDWFQRQKRNFAAEKNSFKVSSMRRWDNFFWWLEIHNLPDEYHVSPYAWNLVKKKKSLQINAKIHKNAKQESQISVGTGGPSATFWLSPKWVDLDKKIHFTYRGRSTADRVIPSQRIILEDLRTRCDVTHPFWASYSYLNKKWVPNATKQQRQAASR